MKKYLITSTLLCFSFLAWNQSSFLLDFNQTRLQKQQNAMKILGSWAVGNIALGAALANRAEGEVKHFHQMNAGWNVINLVIAGFGWYGVSKIDPSSFDLYTTVQEQHKFQKILLFNAGLDIGYMLGGAYLIERAKNTTERPERLKGFGKAIVLQGAFLFTFDVITCVAISSDNKNLAPILNSLSLSPDGIGILLTF